MQTQRKRLTKLVICAAVTPHLKLSVTVENVRGPTGVTVVKLVGPVT